MRIFSMLSSTSKMFRPSRTVLSSSGILVFSVCNSRTNEKVLPLPGSLLTTISPPIFLTISRQIANPNPVPPYWRVVLPSACWNFSKMAACLSLATPIPVSITENLTLATSCSLPRCSIARFTCPFSVNLIALLTKLFRI